MRIAVFTGSAPGVSQVFAQAVAAFGHDLATAGIGIVYGGGRVGLMGVLADAALAAGGDVIGVMPRQLVEREIAHRGLNQLRVVESMHERKAAMAELAGAFVALPGGTGTLDELFEAWTWQTLGVHAKPVALLNIAGYWDHLLGMLDHMSAAGFIRPTDRANLIVAGALGGLVAVLAVVLDARVDWRWVVPLVVPVAAGVVIGLLTGRESGVDADDLGLHRVPAVPPHWPPPFAPWSRIADIRAERHGSRTVVVVYLDTGIVQRLTAPYDGPGLAHDPQFEWKLFRLRNLWETHRSWGSR